MTRNWFERLLIVAQKLKAGVRPPKFPKGPTTVGLSSHRWTWETEGLPELNEGAPWTLKSQGRVARRETRAAMIWLNRIRSWGISEERIKILIFSRGTEKQDFEGLLCGPILPYVQTVGKEGPGPISSLRANECPRTPSRGMDKIAIRGEVEHGGEELGRVRGRRSPRDFCPRYQVNSLITQNNAWDKSYNRAKGEISNKK